MVVVGVRFYFKGLDKILSLLRIGLPNCIQSMEESTAFGAIGMKLADRGLKVASFLRCIIALLSFRICLANLDIQPLSVP